MADTPQDGGCRMRGNAFVPEGAAVVKHSWRGVPMILAVAIESPVLPPHRVAPESPRTI